MAMAERLGDCPYCNVYGDMARHACREQVIALESALAAARQRAEDWEERYRKSAAQGVAAAVMRDEQRARAKKAETTMSRALAVACSECRSIIVAELDRISSDEARAELAKKGGGR